MVDYIIYLHMAFSESLGGFLRYILTYVFYRVTGWFLTLYTYICLLLSRWDK